MDYQIADPWPCRQFTHISETRTAIAWVVIRRAQARQRHIVRSMQVVEKLAESSGYSSTSSTSRLHLQPESLTYRHLWLFSSWCRGTSESPEAFADSPSKFSTMVIHLYLNQAQLRKTSFGSRVFLQHSNFPTLSLGSEVSKGCFSVLCPDPCRYRLIYDLPSEWFSVIQDTGLLSTLVSLWQSQRVLTWIDILLRGVARPAKVV